MFCTIILFRNKFNSGQNEIVPWACASVYFRSFVEGHVLCITKEHLSFLSYIQCEFGASIACETIGKKLLRFILS